MLSKLSLVMNSQPIVQTQQGYFAQQQMACNKC